MQSSACGSKRPRGSRSRAENLVGDIAGRLIAHGRAAEALTWLDRAPARHEGEELVLADLRVAALDALGRKADAQLLRWAAFEQWLGAAHLRAYLRVLPDFDDVEAEDRAVAYALSHPDRNLALSCRAVADTGLSQTLQSLGANWAGGFRTRWPGPL